MQTAGLFSDEKGKLTMKNCENCIHKDVCRMRQSPALFGDDCEHHKTESAAIYTLRLIYSDFMEGANRCRTRAEDCSLRGKAYDAIDLRRQAEIRTSLASRVQSYCRRIGFDPAAEREVNK